MEVKLYKCSDDRRELNKNITDELVIDCDFMHPVEMLNPMLLVAGSIDLVKYNYAYINFFGRYYFIDKIVTRNAKTLELYLSIDVLQTYNNSIKELTVYIDRSESFRNEMLVDSLRPIQANNNYIAVPFGEPVNSVANYHVYLTTGGGE